MRQKIKKCLGMLLVTVLTLLLMEPVPKAYAATIQPKANARMHVQSIGWQSWSADNSVAGTTGKGLRAEAIQVTISGDSKLGIEYCAHVQNVGWMGWTSNGGVSGTTGRSLRVEAIKLRLKGSDKDKYDVYYRTHIQNYGWLDWTKNGQPAGSSDLALRIEAIQVHVVPKGTNPPGNISTPFLSKTKVGRVNILNSSISVKQAKQVSDAFNKIPYIMQYGFDYLGFSVDMNYYNEDWAGLFSSSRSKIYVDAKTQMDLQEVTLHELGHFLDLSVFNSSGSREFTTCYNKERTYLKPMYQGNYNYFINDVKEYYAECFAQYIYNRRLINSTCPNTASKIGKDLNSLSVSNYNKLKTMFDAALSNM